MKFGGNGDDSMMTRILQSFVRFYRKYISPLKGPTCRFYPTCSQYALDALEQHGAWKGTWLTLVRLSKCHPFHKGGIDYVPPNKKKQRHHHHDEGNIS